MIVHWRDPIKGPQERNAVRGDFFHTLESDHLYFFDGEFAWQEGWDLISSPPIAESEFGHVSLYRKLDHCRPRMVAMHEFERWSLIILIMCLETCGVAVDRWHTIRKEPDGRYTRQENISELSIWARHHVNGDEIGWAE